MDKTLQDMWNEARKMYPLPGQFHLRYAFVQGMRRGNQKEKPKAYSWLVGMTAVDWTELPEEPRDYICRS